MRTMRGNSSAMTFVFEKGGILSNAPPDKKVLRLT
jgi:hypothetical protein